MERRRKQDRNQFTKNANSLRVVIFNQQKDLKISRSSVIQLVQFVLGKKKSTAREVYIHFVSKKKICQLHLDHFQDESPTDCISFPIDEEILGEIFICPKVAIEYDEKAPYMESSLYIIHGLLHLMGYNDITTSDQKIMEKEQIKLLKLATKHQCILTALS